MASPAAPSADSFSPSPTQRAAAIAPYSVTRTSSMARLRSGREPLRSGMPISLQDAGRFSVAPVPGLAQEAAGEDHVGPDQPDEIAGLDRDIDAVPGAAEDD